MEAEGKGELKAYQVEAKQLLDNVIAQNKEDKAVRPSSIRLIKVEYRRRTRRRTIPRPSDPNGITLKFHSSH